MNWINVFVEVTRCRKHKLAVLVLAGEVVEDLWNIETFITILKIQIHTYDEIETILLENGLN